MRKNFKKTNVITSLIVKFFLPVLNLEHWDPASQKLSGHEYGRTLPVVSKYSLKLKLILYCCSWLYLLPVIVFRCDSRATKTFRSHRWTFSTPSITINVICFWMKIKLLTRGKYFHCSTRRSRYLLTDSTISANGNSVCINFFLTHWAGGERGRWE